MLVIRTTAMFVLNMFLKFQPDWTSRFEKSLAPAELIFFNGPIQLEINKYVFSYYAIFFLFS